MNPSCIQTVSVMYCIDLAWGLELTAASHDKHQRVVKHWLSKDSAPEARKCSTQTPQQLKLFKTAFIPFMHGARYSGLIFGRHFNHLSWSNMSQSPSGWSPKPCPLIHLVITLVSFWDMASYIQNDRGKMNCIKGIIVKFLDSQKHENIYFELQSVFFFFFLNLFSFLWCQNSTFFLSLKINL